MKRLSKIIVLLISLFLGINIVNASQDCSDIEMIGIKNDGVSSFWKSTQISMQYGGNTHVYDRYTLKYKNGAITAYCRQPGYVDGLLGESSTYKCKRVIFDPTSTFSGSEEQKAFDYGILYLAKQTTATSTNKDYVTVTLALRIYEMMWPDFNSNGGNSKIDYNAHKFIANKWLDDSEIYKLVKDATGAERKKFTGAVEVINWNGQNIGDIESAAKAKFKDALEAVKNYRQNGSASIKVDEHGLKTRDSEENNGKVTYTATATYGINISKFIADGAAVGLGFVCDNCTAKNVNYEIYINNTKVSIASGSKYAIDMSTLQNDGGRLSGDLDVKIVFTSDSNKYSCDVLDYRLIIHYSEDTIGGTVYEMAPKNLAGASGVQGFWAYVPPQNNDGFMSKITINDSIDLCTLSCTDLEQKCKSDGADSAACKLFAEKYNSTCKLCGTNVINAVCSEPDGTTKFTITEGYELDTDKCSVKGKNIKGCIVNGEDVNGNSYVVMANKYCSVSCKEDYTFEFPGHKGVLNGGYFTLAANVKGTKSCYTSTINKAKFDTDICEAAKRTVDAFNEVSKYNEMAKITKNSDFAKKNCSEGTTTVTNGTTKETRSGSACAGTTEYDNCMACWNTCEADNEIQPLANKKKCSACASCANITCEVDVPTTATYKTVRCKNINYDQATISGNCSSGSVSKTTFEYYDVASSVGEAALYPAEYVEKGHFLTDAEKDFEEAYGKESIKEYVVTGSGSQGKSMPSVPMTSVSVAGSLSLGRILIDYNSCQTWQLKDYNYDPDLHFWYEWASGEFKESNKVVEDTAKAQICTGNVDDAYDSCGGGWKANEQKTEKSIFYCYNEGSENKCSTEKFMVSTATHVKKSLDASAQYIATTNLSQVPPSGAIVEGSAEGGIALNEKLPVPLGLDMMPHRYIMYFTKLGEYYKTDNLGRIWGSGASVLATTLKETSKCQWSEDLSFDRTINTSYFDKGVYSCTYTNTDTILCNKPDGTQVDITDCVKGGKSEEQCRKDAGCDTDKIICHKPDGTPVDITDCVKGGKTEDQCTEEKCCPDCEPIPKCTKKDGLYYGPDGKVISESEYNSKCFCTKKDGSLVNIRTCVAKEGLTEKQCKTKYCQCPENYCLPKIICNGEICFNFRPISPSDLNPNDRDIGPNWSYDDEVDTALELKAYVTTKEIEEENESIFEVNFDNSDQFAMEVTMDSKMINYIKEYNKEHKNDGYADNSLKCYSYESVDKVKYPNVFCYSTFIDGVLNTKLSKNIKIPSNITRPSTENERSKYNEGYNYWTTWTMADIKKWDIITERELSYYKTNYGKDINIGPSWK